LRYRNRAMAAARLRSIAAAGPEERIALLVRESGFGMSAAALIARTGMMPNEIEALGGSHRFVVLRQPDLWLIDAEWFRSKWAALRREVSEFHQSTPLLPGIAKQDLRGRLLAGVPAFVLDALLGAAAEIAVEGDLVRLAAHQLVLREDEEKARAAIENAFEQT